MLESLKKISFSSFSQVVCITAKLYLKNDLLNYAAACAFGFMFSFIPIAILTLTILLRILHASPELVSSIIHLNEYLVGIDGKLKSFIDSITNIRSFSIFDIVVGLFIIWMSRRFFASVMAGMKAIFHRTQKIKYGLTQVIIFSCEIIIVIFIALFIFVFISANNIVSSQWFKKAQEILPPISEIGNSFWVKIMPNIVSFAGCTIAYRILSHSKPAWRFCLLTSFVHNLSFIVFQIFMICFMNASQYNLVYGVFAKLIILLTEIWVYFTLFLIFAEATFVLQNFKELSIAELYLLPKTNSFGAKFLRFIFSKTKYLESEKENTIFIEANKEVYKKGDSSDCVYYIISGKVLAENGQENTEPSYYSDGDFFGEAASILNKKRVSTVRTVTDSKLLKISNKDFTSILEKNHSASSQALERVSEYLAQIDT